MKRFLAIWLIGIAMILSSFCNASFAQNVVRLTNGEWPPFQSKNALKHHGVLSRIVTEAFAAQGIQVKYGFFPWKRALNYAKTGVWDGSVGWAWNRADFVDAFYFSDPILTVPKALFYLKKQPVKWETMDDLAGLTIGVTDGYTYGVEFDKAREDGVFEVQEVSTDLQNIHKLLFGRFDAFAMGIDVAYYLLHKNFLPDEIEKVAYWPKPLTVSEMCVIFPIKNKNSPFLIRTLNRGLDELKKGGRIDAYVQESRIGKYIIK